jgi:diketogulonate reductase-like aldo/keto reductase
MRVLQENFVLENGIEIPKIGFGTWQIPIGDIAFNSVSFALKNGYRHIDTALAYDNEESVGGAVRTSGIERSDIFVTSKLPAEIKNYKKALECIDKTMKNLGLEYIDMYLIHAPWPWDKKGQDFTKGNIEVWKAIEEFYESGRCRAVGVSNFNVHDITAIMENGTIKPMANQIKIHIGYTQEEITQFCKENNILVEGYSPLATGKILENEIIKSLAGKYDKSLARVCIRYVLQKGFLPLPKSITPERILENSDVDFEISKEDMDYLDGLKNTVKNWY